LLQEKVFVTSHHVTNRNCRSK